MARTLKDAGVTADRISIFRAEPDAIEAALQMARPGDLVVIFGDNLTRSWKQIIYFNGGDATQMPSQDDATPSITNPMPAVAVPPVPAVTGPRLHPHVIADERGVRLARTVEHED